MKRKKRESIEVADSGAVYSITCRGDQVRNLKTVIICLIVGAVLSYFPVTLWLRGFRYLAGTFKGFAAAKSAEFIFGMFSLAAVILIPLAAFAGLYYLLYLGLSRWRIQITKDGISVRKSLLPWRAWVPSCPMALIEGFMHELEREDENLYRVCVVLKDVNGRWEKMRKILHYTPRVIIARTIGEDDAKAIVALCTERLGKLGVDLSRRPASLAAVRDYHDWGDLADEERNDASVGVFKEAGKRLEKSKVVKIEDDEKVELRAKSGGFPVRAVIDISSAEVSLEARIVNTAGSFFYLSFNPEKTPKHPDPDDSWADKDDSRIFVGEGVFVEGDRDTVRDSLRTLLSLSGSLLDEIAAGMKKLGLEFLNLHSADMAAGFRRELYELDDPSSDIAEAIAFITRIAEKLKAEKPRDDAANTSLIREIVRCQYCGTRYPLGIRTNCPNCGAG